MLRPFPSSMRAVATTPAESVGACIARFPTHASLPRQLGESASASIVSRPARRSLALPPAWSLGRPRRPFVIRVLQPMSLPPSSAPTATGWSDSCRAGFAPAEEWRLRTAHQLKARLSDAFDRFLEGVPDNRQVVFDDDGWRLKTDPAEHLDPAQSDSLVELHRWLDARSRSIRLADLLIEVENDLGFSVHFQAAKRAGRPRGSVRAARRDPRPRPLRRSEVADMRWADGDLVRRRQRRPSPCAARRNNPVGAGPTVRRLVDGCATAVSRLARRDRAGHPRIRSPGAVPHTSTYALTNATMAYALAIADHGWRGAAERDPALAKGINVVDGQVTHPAVAAAHGFDCAHADPAIANAKGTVGGTSGSHSNRPIRTSGRSSSRS